MPKHKRGLLIVLSGPSGVGKSTIVKRLRKINPRLKMSVSCTTRPPRLGEANKRDYFFISKEAFTEKVKNGEFLEWAEVHGRYYGTPREFIEENLKKNNVVLLEVDVQGAGTIKDWLYKARLRKSAVFVFIIPPSVDMLAFRLKRRKTESSELLNYRLRAAIAELQVMEKYDYIVVNDQVEHAARKIQAIINVEKERVLLN
ncbi:guanylate kinase [candidate division WOR-1 bacterium RIFOXYA12_FULL_43_27]|uniref:Guanylate kinase n=1 Tax=candidate division WOR-1 bacterium RIFOXYC2_FULL_46_14 TaxID=1802587 RepID=A0A1F4U4T5_UNCSA|nr:MAG: guanylate kinase [candidate division WOR-1 bacterium RIFOXYA12_FULL_43_27]OGC20728.1 MAG: guanylate kinase [candidate division WOR-1 bacterium RIFOXYB2_FULL_46_45]OGC31535.1 MAG: guanylate kinase [candidate division WOR-1 bacterium RIFOXYA2_FULL_46_56]OGC39942.1 MAG: guanylate kinase [candidate division WOR-1 bacterium RIFOXYC2_FULL_46_14]